MRYLRAAISLVAAAQLAGCNVGAYVDIGPDDDPPSVSLAASPATASRGDTVGLVAAASDDYRVIEVEFYRLESGADTFLGRDSSAPYALDTVVPAGASGDVRYLARAIDDAGQASESQAVTIAVQ